MALARWQATITDEAGNVIPGAEIEVHRETAGLPLVQLYSDRDGNVAIGNPFNADAEGFAFFHVLGGEFKIIARSDGDERIWRYVPVGLAAGSDAGGGDDSVQSVISASDTIEDLVTNVAINRTAPSTTALALPDASIRNGRELRIADYSQSVTGHTITLTPFQASQKIMRQSTWPLYSNAANLASVTLFPVIDPDDADNYVWVIAP